MKGLKLALRVLMKSPFVTGVAILSLALGIGANAAIYSVFDQMLLRPLPVVEPDRLVNFAAPGPNPGSQSCGQAGGCGEVFSYAMFRDLQAYDAQGFSGLAGHVPFGVNLAMDGRTTNGTGAIVSGSYFPTLGVRPTLGRLLSLGDDEKIGEHDVVVLSHRYWQNELGADPGVLNRTLIVNGRPMAVVGVAAAGFEGTVLGEDPDVFVPLAMRDAVTAWTNGLEDRRWYWLYVFGRLAPGATLEQAGAELTAVYNQIINEVEAPLQTEMSEATMARFRAKQITFAPGFRGQSTLHGEATTPLTLLFAITGMVLLIACANIANLLLARGSGRAHEMAIRGSMGANRRQLLGQLLTESLLLATLGGLGGLLVAEWTLRFLTTVIPPEAQVAMDMHLSPAMVMFSAALSLGTGIVFGMYPAFHATRPALMTTLRGHTGQPSGARAAARFRSSLVMAQIALSMALLVGAGLFLKSLMNVSRVDLGLHPDNVVTFAISPELNGYEPEESMALFTRAEEEIAAIPGVTSVTASVVAALAGNSWGQDVSVEGFEWSPDVNDNSRYNKVGPGYFGTMGIPLIAGREFTAADVAGGAKVAIVNEAFTRKFGIEGPQAVGKRMALNSHVSDLDVEIVGVVRDAKYSDVKQDVPPVFAIPYRQDESVGYLHFYVRTGIDPSTVLRAIPGVVKRLDANLPVEGLKTLEQQIDETLVLDRLISTLSAAFAVLATLLAAVGLYGVLSYTVAQRTREIGLRMALGAGGQRVQGMVLRQLGQMALMGGLVGLVAAWGMGRWAESVLFGVDGSDPVVMAMVVVLLALVALAAGYVPARRASRVDPMVALRYE